MKTVHHLSIEEACEMIESHFFARDPSKEYKATFIPTLETKEGIGMDGGGSAKRSGRFEVEETSK